MPAIRKPPQGFFPIAIGEKRQSNGSLRLKVSEKLQFRYISTSTPKQLSNEVVKRTITLPTNQQGATNASEITTNS